MRVWCFIFCFLPALAFGRAAKAPVPSLEGRIGYYVSLYSNVGGDAQSSADLATFVDKLERKQASFKSTPDFLQYVFDKTHQKFLKNFSEYASFGEMLNQGKYNCLTGTALYALVLEHLDIRYKIVETNYHIFLLAQTDTGTVLFEATDPLSGFVTNDKEIEKRIASYRQNRVTAAGNSKTYYRYSVDLYNSVNLDQVVGLLHYNLSIVAFNANELSLSIDHLGKAMESYQSPRFEEFSKIILLSIVEGDLSPSEKERCMESIRSLRQKHVVVTASRD